jgi:hypothetical protein
MWTGCGLFGKKKKKDKPGTVVQYFVHGDPEELIKGARLNGESFLTLDRLSALNDYHLSAGYDFSERSEEYNPASFDEVENQNSTDKSDEDITESFAFTNWSFRQIGQGSSYRFAPASGPLDLSIGFQLRQGRLELVDINRFPVTVLHYSIKPDASAFSFLVRFDSKDYGRRLLSLSFGKSNEVQPLPEAAKDFSYLYGNRPIGWKQDVIELHACGTFDEPAKESIRKSVEAWVQDPQVALAEGRQNVKLSFKTDYAPFSDVNDHCLILVDNFRAENSTRFYTAGMNLPVINLASKSIVDSDIVIFLRNKRGEFLGQAGETTMHELGHFFGLGHEFAEDSAGLALYRSIMGYSQGSDTIQTRDFEAIRGIYGKALGTIE